MFKTFIEKILKHNKVAVFSHLSPDGDCIGSQIGLCRWLEKNGVQATALNQDDLPENLQWLSEIYPIQKPGEVDLASFDAFAFVDGNVPYRFGNAADSLGSDRPLYMIDHHPEPSEVFEEMVSETSKSSTCELVYDLYMEHDERQLDPDTSRALYVGIMTDTGSYQFSSVSPATMRAGAMLLEKGGFTPNEIAEPVYSVKKMKQLKLLSMALDSIESYADGQITTISITREMFEQTETSKEDTEGFVAYPLSIDTAKCCVLFREEEGGGVKLSLRSRSDVDVNRWAREFNGGGHKMAAGAFYDGTLEEAVRDVIAVGKKQL